MEGGGEDDLTWRSPENKLDRVHRGNLICLALAGVDTEFLNFEIRE